jgi:hypothetical protein
MNTQTTIAHRSFSSLTSWIRCGKAWELERKYEAPSEPAWWFVGGSAFHVAAEKFLKHQFELSTGKVKDEGVPF